MIIVLGWSAFGADRLAFDSRLTAKAPFKRGRVASESGYPPGEELIAINLATTAFSIIGAPSRTNNKTTRGRQ